MAGHSKEGCFAAVHHCFNGIVRSDAPPNSRAEQHRFERLSLTSVGEILYKEHVPCIAATLLRVRLSGACKG